jgi:hypothetical protein
MSLSSGITRSEIEGRRCPLPKIQHQMLQTATFAIQAKIIRTTAPEEIFRPTQTKKHFS